MKWNLYAIETNILSFLLEKLKGDLSREFIHFGLKVIPPCIILSDSH